MSNKVLLSGILLFLFFSATAFAVEECIACQNVSGAPQANMLVSVNDVAKTATALVYHENFTAEVPRVPITDSVIFVYVTPSVGDSEMIRVYTDGEGRAVFDFSSYATRAQEERLTYSFRFIYCPFCHPGALGYPCGFEECMKFAGIEIAYTEPGDVPVGAGVTVPSALNEGIYLPTSKSVTYVPPPPEATGATTPAFCLPLVIIFALLGGALYYTGRNPFAAFSIGTPRMGRHIRYTPTGRGYSLSARYVAQSIAGGVKEAKGIKAGMKKGKSLGKAVAETSFGLGKGAGKRIALNALTLGTYSNVVNLVSTVKGGQRVVSSTQIAGKAGVERAEEKVVTAPSAKEIFKKAGAKARGSYISMAQPGRLAPEGKAEKGAGAKAFGKMVGGALLNVGIGLLGSSFVSMFMKEDTLKRMGEYTDKLIVSEAAEKLGAKDISYDKMMKLTGKEAGPKAPEIVIDKATMERDGTLKADVVKDAAGNDVIIGTKTVKEKNKTIEYSFSGKVGDKLVVDSVKVTEGSGEKAVIRNFLAQKDGTLKLESVTLGEGGKTYTMVPVPKTDKQAIAEITYKEGERQVNIVELPKETEKQVMGAIKDVTPPKGGKLTMESAGIKAAPNVLQEISKYIYTSTEVNMAGKEGPVTINKPIGAGKGDFSYTETQKDGSKIEYSVKDGNVVSASKIGVDGTRTALGTEKSGVFEGTQMMRGGKTDVLERYDKIVERQTDFLKACEAIDKTPSKMALEIAYEKMPGLKATSGFTETMETGIESMKVTEKAGKKTKEVGVSDETKQLLIYNAPQLNDPDRYPGGPDKEAVKDFFKGAADGGMAGAIQGKFGSKDPEKQAAVDAIAGIGTGLADMKKKDYMAAVETQLDMRADLSPKQKEEALDSAEKLWKVPHIRASMKDIANDYAKAGEQAAAAYPGYKEVENKALEQLKPLYKEDELGLKKMLIEDAAKQMGATPPPAELEMSSSEALVRAIIHETNKLDESSLSTTWDKEDNRVTNPEQKLLLEMIDNGLSKPPAPAKPLDVASVTDEFLSEKVSQKPGEATEDYVERMKKDGILTETGEANQEKLTKMQEDFFKTKEHERLHEEKKKRQEYDSFYYGKESENALAASTVILTAIKKGDKLGTAAYSDAMDGIAGGNADKWGDAAKEAAKYVEQQEQKKEVKRQKELKSLGEEKLG